MLADVDVILRQPLSPTNFTSGNIQQDPPPFPPFLFRDILVNDMVTAVTKAVLGSRPKNSYYSGNTNLPGSRAQPVHVDSGQLWPNMAAGHPAYALVVNVPVVATTPANGSTEIWRGTHLDPRQCMDDPDIKIPEPWLEERRAHVPPFQPVTEVGDVLIRDIRLWHRGMPNASDLPRPMIAMIHYAHWMDTGAPLVFPKGTEPFCEHTELRTNAVFVDGPIDYISRNAPFDLQDGQK
jgi:hypothetical protein